MVIEYLCALATCVVLAFSVFLQPTRATCPGSYWYLDEGIKSTGEFRCVQQLVGGENDAVQPPGEIYGKIHCTGGARPIVVNYRTVGCQR